MHRLLRVTLNSSCAMRHAAASAPPTEFPLNSSTLLRVIRDEGGEVAEYYAEKYFGGKASLARINQLLWNDLKKSGQVKIERKDLNSVPRWLPITNLPPRSTQVTVYRPEDHDLSLLAVERNVSAQHESTVLANVPRSPPSVKTLPRTSARRPSTFGLSVPTGDVGDFLDPQQGWWKSDLAAFAQEASAPQK